MKGDNIIVDKKEKFIVWIDKKRLNKITPLQLANVLESAFSKILCVNVWGLTDEKEFSHYRNKILDNNIYKINNKEDYKILNSYSQYYQIFLKICSENDFCKSNHENKNFYNKNTEYNRLNNSFNNNENISKNETESVILEVGDVISLVKYGRSVIVGLEEECIEVRCVDNIKRKILKTFAVELAINGIKKIKDIKNKFSLGDFISHLYFGYAKIISISDEGMDIMKINDNSICFIEPENFFYFDVILNERYISILSSVRKNDFILFDGDMAIVNSYDRCNLSIVTLLSNKSYNISLDKAFPVKSEMRKKWALDNINSLNFQTFSKIYFDKDYYEYNELIDSAKKVIIDSKFKNYNENKIESNLSQTKLEKCNDIFLSERFIDLEEYILHEMFKTDVYFYNYKFESSNYSYYIDKLCRKQLAIKFDDERYFTFNKLASFGVTSKDILDFKYSLISYLKVNDFVSYSKIADLISNRILNVLFSNQLLENFIKSFDEFKSYKIGNRVTFVIKSNDLKKEYLENIISKYIKSKGVKSYDVYRLIIEINEKYDFDFSFESFLCDVVKFEKIYYSEETEKIYINKKNYYEEIYR
ncbi:hypothetical protein [Thomasclavelia cocleata]|uniref:hypothetical protein n=1 Tax=Thomasclavelia cocleata TaxID=69824 RepID=UPI002583F583|nr:hypothetical protein [Thomasclavelia cocleata]